MPSNPQTSDDQSVRLEQLSRELRTPLTDILGMAHLLDDTVLEEDQKQYVQAIMRASHEVLVQVDNTIDLAQLSKETLGVEEDFFGITEALLVMVERLRPSAASKGLGVSLEFAPDIGTKIHCDKARLSQAVFNLTAHLVEQYSDGVLRMTAEIKADKWGNTLCITVISKAVRGNAANAKPDNTHALDITRRLARLMGGDVSLKIDEHQTCQGQLSIRVETPEEETEDQSRVARILVAEDSRANQRLIGLILGKLGHEYELVSNGVEAVEAVKNQAYDMVLMDLHMPLMDGMDACRKIRELEDRISALVPIIALTADVRPEMPQRVLEAGMDAFLTKPLDVTKLSETIQACMKSQKTEPLRRALRA
jgi:two-component system, sensor histidine kinase